MVMMKRSNKATLSPEEPNILDVHEKESKGSGVAVPVDVQIELARNRLSLAEFQYEMSVRKGHAWDVSESDRIA